MRNSPFAMLITPIWPNVSVSPSAASNKMAPVAVPVRKGVVSRFILCFRSSFGAAPVGRSGGGAALTHGTPDDRQVFGSWALPGARIPPAVALEERIRLDRTLGREHDV